MSLLRVKDRRTKQASLRLSQSNYDKLVLIKRRYNNSLSDIVTAILDDIDIDDLKAGKTGKSFQMRTL